MPIVPSHKSIEMKFERTGHKTTAIFWIRLLSSLDLSIPLCLEHLKRNNRDIQILQN